MRSAKVTVASVAAIVALSLTSAGTAHAAAPAAARTQQLATVVRLVRAPSPAVTTNSVSCSYHAATSKFFTFKGTTWTGFEYAGHYSGLTVQPSSTAVSSAGEEAQCLLKFAGYNVGTIDGVFGPKSQAAMKLFQRNQNDNQGAGLVVDGMVGPEVLAMAALGDVLLTIAGLLA